MTGLLALTLAVAVSETTEAQEVVRQFGGLTIRADPAQAFPGGVLVVHLAARFPIGTAFAILGGSRFPCFATRQGARALVPIPVTMPPGKQTLGIELWTRRGRQRMPLDVPVAPRAYPARTVVIPEAKRPLVKRPDSVRDGRHLLRLLRTETPEAAWSGPLRAPVETAPVASFGAAQTYVGGSPVERMMDSIFGEYHRGLDYEVPAGTLVQAPGPGTVLFAGSLTLTGQTVVLDHGQGVISALYHLSRIDVKDTDRVEGRAPLGLSGETGIAAAPHLHWGVYLHGVAVDPRALETLAPAP